MNTSKVRPGKTHAGARGLWIVQVLRRCSVHTRPSMPPVNHGERGRTSLRSGRRFSAVLFAAVLACLSGPSIVLDNANANSARTPDYDYEAPVPGSYPLPCLLYTSDAAD